MKSKLLILSLAAPVFLFLTSIALAQSPTVRPLNERQIENRCFVAGTLIENRVEKFRNHRDDHIARYNRIKDRFTALVTKLTEKGYDTTQLKADLQIFNEKIKKFHTDVDAFHKKLAEANNYNCGDSEGAFKSKILEARDLLKIIRADIVDIHDFFKNIIKPDFQAVRAQKKSPSPTI